MPDKLACSGCGADLLIGAKFCIECGASAASLCEACGAVCPVAALYCPLCGARIAPARRQLSGERRQLTTMFCDLVGWTRLSRPRDPEEVHRILKNYREACGQIAQNHGGYIVRYLGDGLLVYFG